MTKKMSELNANFSRKIANFSQSRYILHPPMNGFHLKVTILKTVGYRSLVRNVVLIVKFDAKPNPKPYRNPNRTHK